MGRRSGQNHLLLYLLLNVIVSAATILAVLLIWERVRQPELPPAVPTSEAPLAPTPTTPAPPPATPTVALPSGGPVIEIAAVIGATDPQQE